MSGSSRAEDALRSLGRVTEALGDRLNPVLVKDVRQALRGKAFSVSFVLALSLATLGSITWMVSAPTNSNMAAVGLLTMLSFCLSLAICLQVPLSAFQSLVAEWEGDSMDLLQLTDLRPWGIVFGKLCAAGVQVMLYLCAFAPFILTTFLMRGVGVSTIFWAFSTSLSSSATLVGLALGVAAFGRRRVVRVLLLLLLVAACVATVFNQTMRMRFSVGSPSTAAVLQTVGLTQLVLSTLWLVYPALLACGVAASRLTHPFEDRSLLPRLVVSVYVVGDLGFSAWRQVAGMPGTAVSSSMVAMGIVGLFGAFFATEADALPPVRAHELPRHPRLALAATPFLGGGGRGALFVFLHLFVIAVATRAIIFFGPAPSGPSPDDHFPTLVALGLVIVIWILLPSAILPRSTEKGRFTSRMLIPAIALCTTCIPPILVFFLGARGSDLAHFGNPVWVVLAFDHSNSWLEALLQHRPGLGWTLMVAAGAAALVNAPRILNGVHEVHVAGSRLRRR